MPLPRGAGDRRAAVPRARHARAVGAGGRGRSSRCSPPTASTSASTPRRRHADAGDLARDPHAQPRRRRGTADGIVVTPSHNPPGDGGFKYNPPHGGPADTDVTGWIEREANALLEAGLDGVKRMPYEQAGRRRHRCDYLSAYVDDLAVGDRPRRDPRVRPAARRRPARRRQRRLLGGDRRAPRARPRDRQRRGRPDVPLRAARLGRQDPDGLLVAVRDGAADRDARPLRRRVRQRPGRRPPRHRHAVGRAC